MRICPELSFDLSRIMKQAGKKFNLYYLHPWLTSQINCKICQALKQIAFFSDSTLSLLISGLLILHFRFVSERSAIQKISSYHS